MISKPVSTLFVKKPAADIMSERIYTRLTPREMKRLKARIGKMFPISELIRDLLAQYLDKKNHYHH